MVALRTFSSTHFPWGRLVNGCAIETSFTVPSFAKITVAAL